MRKSLRGFAASLALASFGAGAYEAMPAQPRAGQEFVLYIDKTLGCGATTHVGQASVSGSIITVSYPTADACFLLPPGSPYYVNTLVNVPEPGTYLVVEKSTNHNETRNAGQLVVFPAAASAARTSTSLAGLWYVPSQPGWGVNIAEGQSGQLFLTWFTYGSGASIAYNTAPSLWMFASGGRWTSSTEFTGVLALSVGTPYNKPFDPGSFASSPIGSATVSVTGVDSLTFAVQYVLADGKQAQAFNLSRYRF